MLEKMGWNSQGETGSLIYKASQHNVWKTCEEKKDCSRLGLVLDSDSVRAKLSHGAVCTRSLSFINIAVWVVLLLGVL